MARFEPVAVLMLDLTSKRIHELAIEKASRYLIAEAELLSAIIDVDRNRIYEKFDETHFTPYCVKYLNLSEDVAAMFVRVARKSHQVPELERAVQEGLQITKARTIASVIAADNKDEWIEKGRTLSKEKLEREVAAANPNAPKPERAKPTGPNRIRIEFEVTYEEAEVLKRARELLSQKRSKNAQIGETFMMALSDWVKREDLVRKAKRSNERKAKHQPQPTEQESPKQAQKNERRERGDRSRDRSQSRSSVPAQILHLVNLRDRGACRKRMPDGSNCGCRKWTEIHHIHPRAYGGPDTVENLITLCRAHHQQMHRH